jgi:chemotaxis methyl-accepting protein methylase
MRDSQITSYESYLMRLRWVEVEEDEQIACQIMLQNVATKERHFFRDLDSVSAFLKAQVVQSR